MFRASLLCLLALFCGTAFSANFTTFHQITVAVNNVTYMNCTDPMVDQDAMLQGYYHVIVPWKGCSSDTTWCKSRDFECAAIPAFRDPATLFNVTIDGDWVAETGANMGGNWLCWGVFHCSYFAYPESSPSSTEPPSPPSGPPPPDSGPPSSPEGPPSSPSGYGNGGGYGNDGGYKHHKY